MLKKIFFFCLFILSITITLNLFAANPGEAPFKKQKNTNDNLGQPAKTKISLPKIEIDKKVIQPAEDLPPLFIRSFPRRTSWGARILLEIETSRDLNNTSIVVKFRNKQAQVDNVSARGAGKYILTVVIPQGASSGLINVSAYGQTAQSQTPIEIFGPPNITAVEPLNCPIGAELIIRGNNFVPAQQGEGTTVEFNSSAHTSGKKDIIPTSVTPTEIRLTIAAGTLKGPFTIKTIVGGNVFSCVSRQALTIIPNIGFFLPKEGRPGGKIEIHGTSFGLNPRVEIAGVNAEVNSFSEREMQVTVPQNARTGKIKVINSDGQAESRDDFRFLTGPLIRSISPNQAGVGATITLEGEDLDLITSASMMFSRGARGFGKTPIIITKERNQAQLRLPQDIDTPGPCEISVYMPVFWSNKFPFTVSAEGMRIRTPQVYDFRPIRTAIGARIIIEAYDLTYNSASDINVRIGNVNLPIQDIINRGIVSGREKTELIVDIPQNAVTARVSISCYGVTGTSLTELRVYGPVTISEITPMSARRGAWLTIRGTNFVTLSRLQGEGTCIYFKRAGGDRAPVPDSAVRVNSENEMQVMVPATAASGTISIETVVGGKSFSTTSSAEFTVLP